MTLLLIVEDNEMNADMLIRRLARKGFETCLAKNGLDAIKMAEELHPELILMDISLPEMDGYEATHRIRNGVNGRVPIIALTAHAMSEDRDKAIKAGCDEYETKPVNFLSLMRKITALLERHDDV